MLTAICFDELIVVQQQRGFYDFVSWVIKFNLQNSWENCAFDWSIVVKATVKKTNL